MASATQSKIARLAINLTILAFSMGITLLVLEFIARATAPKHFVMFPRNHAAADYGDYQLRRMTPNTSFYHQSYDGRWRFDINNKGFRDRDPYHHDKPNDVFRILVLGDSHTAGFEVRQKATFSNVVERVLKRKDQKVEVINTGVSGMGTAEQLVFLREEGLKYKPDAVVVAFYSNDFVDNVRAGFFEIKNGKLINTTKTKHAPATKVIKIMNSVPGVKWLTENSYLTSILLNTVWDIAKGWSISAAQEKISEREGPELAVQVKKENNYETQLSILLLSRVAEISRENGALTILVDVPKIDGAKFGRSLTKEMEAQLASWYTSILTADRYLKGLPEEQAVHVPHGHRHINEFTHGKVGEAIAAALSKQQ